MLPALYGNEHEPQPTMERPPLTPHVPTVHDLKLWMTFFGVVANGEKPFEVRRNDRRYQVGDVLRLREWNPSKEVYTGRECMRTVRQIISGGQFGIEQGYIILTFEPTLPPRLNQYHELQHLLAWMSTRKDAISIGSSESCGEVVDVLVEYCTANNIPTL